MITKDDIEAFSDTYEMDEAVSGDHEEFEVMEEPSPYDQSRWTTFYSVVLKHVPTETFWNVTYQRGSTEYQECDADYEMVRVYPHSVMKTVYKTTE